MDLIDVLKRVDEIFSGRPYEENKKRYYKKKDQKLNETFNEKPSKNTDIDTTQNIRSLIKNTSKNNFRCKRLYFPKKYITLSNNKVNTFKFDISNLLIEKKELTETVNLMKEFVTDENRQRLLKEVIELEKNKDKLLKSKKKLSEDVNKLSFQKEMLLVEMEEIKQKKSEFLISNTAVSLEYIDSLTSGLDFEKAFALILDKLNYTDIVVTSGSGDFGIDVLATKDDVLYGFQCKLYSNPVGNEAVQEAFAGKTHYNCNVVIVVTNNYFTSQAEKQALDTQVILWDRDILKKKIDEYSSKK